MTVAMRMRHNDQRQKIWLETMNDILAMYTEAFENRDTKETIRKRREEFMTRIERKGLPGHKRAEISGAAYVLMRQLENRLVWTHVYKGKRVLAEEVPLEEVRKLDSSLSGYCYPARADGLLLPFVDALREDDLDERRTK